MFYYTRSNTATHESLCSNLTTTLRLPLLPRLPIVTAPCPHAPIRTHTLHDYRHSIFSLQSATRRSLVLLIEAQLAGAADCDEEEAADRSHRLEEVEAHKVGVIRALASDVRPEGEANERLDEGRRRP